MSSHLLPFRGNEQLGLLRLHLLEVSPNLLRNAGLRERTKGRLLSIPIPLHPVSPLTCLCDADRYDLDARSPEPATFLERQGQILVQLVELVDVHFAQGVLRAELVDLVMDLLENPRAVVVDCVIPHGLQHVFLPETIHHFHLVCKALSFCL